MLRRDFLTGGMAAITAASVARTFAQQVAKCCANIGTDGKLTPIIPITMGVNYVRRYGNKDYPEWSDAHKDIIEKARQEVSRVWSSAEFKSAVVAVQEFIWQDSLTMSGDELYAKLTVTSQKQMKVAAGKRSKKELAISFPDGETLIELHYLNDRSARVSDFVHTLSLEYTHYTAGVESWDRGHSGDVTRYVSYGIGCITQKLAFPSEPCAYEIDTDVTGPPPRMPGVPVTTFTFRQAIPKRENRGG